MTMRITLFTATLVQDSALSVSGLDREATAEQPFAFVDGKPVLVGRGLKGAAVAMARRFFEPLPRIVSDEAQERLPREKRQPLIRSVWEFEDATPIGYEAFAAPSLRAGVGIRQKTGARAQGLLFDRETIPSGTRWKLRIRVDGSHTFNRDKEVVEAEGILGYVLEEHWAKRRCWLGGGVARGLGFCHIEDLRAYRLEGQAYDDWVNSERARLPGPLADIPKASPTRSWFFKTLDLTLTFGEYRPEPNEPTWGLDMLAVGSHEADRTIQRRGNGRWARPPWAKEADTPESFETDRSLVMEGERPLLPGSSLRGPLRHAFSRAARMGGEQVEDPNRKDAQVGQNDLAGLLFGTVDKSSRVLIRDGRADDEWVAARLHMHAEDEFSAGSYGSAKRNAVRLLQGKFPMQIVVEGGEASQVEKAAKSIDRLIALGKLGHLPVGGQKTRGAGFGRWQAGEWEETTVLARRKWEPSAEPSNAPPATSKPAFEKLRAATTVSIRTKPASLPRSTLTLGEAADMAKKALGGRELVAWFCDPTINLALDVAPVTFGQSWPEDEELEVDEVAFYAKDAVWRAARTSKGVRSVFIEELKTDDEEKAKVVHVPARLHAFSRFSAAKINARSVVLREWHVGGEVRGFTIQEVR